MKKWMVILSFLGLVQGVYANTTCEQAIQETQQIILKGQLQQIQLTNLHQCQQNLQDLEMKLSEVTIDHCAGAFWCYVIPSKEACEDADSCHWVKGKRN